MTKIEATTIVKAPTERVFAASLRIDVEAAAEKDFQLHAVGGVKSGPIARGETVTWRTRQFGIWVEHTTLISRLEAPVYFQDRMQRGIFREFVHDHWFRSLGESRTEMRDELWFSFPAVLGGVATERLLLRARVAEMLRRRNAEIRKVCEAGGSRPLSR